MIPFRKRPLQARTAKALPAEPSTPRAGLSRLLLILLVAAFILIAHNHTFWGRAQTIFDGNLRALAVFGLAIYALTVFTAALLGPGRALKPALAFLLILSSVTSYYMDSLGVMIDRDMIQNVMKTTLT
ncbi:MAG: hypothetical protein RIT14_1516, partial [Pseudomonadota bacterium]